MKNLEFQELSNKETLEINGGCNEWMLLFGLPGLAAYVGYHDASGGKHDDDEK
ncbi:hypothetical protein [Aquimarina aggregata]|uniref:hypothetical protein n=1 Tax=Aquimarina aggregata TaxID=1642818 RepID=UPI000A7F5EB4|nr:hypothetical protein [Aquimarina aggregata]